MRRLNTRAPRIAGLLALALGAVALLALPVGAVAKDRHGNDHGHHHGRHHHFLDMREAGTISSFDETTGKLTIALTGGESITGLVTEETRIKCEGVDDRLDRRDHGGHGEEPGDDNGERGEEPGDDHGGDNSGPGPSGEDGAPVPVGSPEGEGQTCDVASLVPGAFVGDAELRLGTGMAVFDEVELGQNS
ncbi:MAG TPA: hypothetical protein VGI17_17195 [Solirubrobacterales bacterium]|jgi:hypothetical protein